MRLLVLVVLLAACGSQPSSSPQDPGSNAAAAPTAGATAGGESLTGTLGGDQELEGGCTWLDADGQRWQVQYPAGWQLTWDPLTLSGPDGQTAGEGETVTVTGAEQPDVMTTCQVGPVWAATSVSLDTP